MLRKLLKYDIKYIKKLWTVLAIVSLCLSVIAGVSLAITENGDYYGSFIVLCPTLFYLSLACLVIAPFVLSIYRFYQNLYTDEGYLTFTLPVKKQDILISKFLTTALSLLSSVIVVFVDVFICALAEVIFTKDKDGISGGQEGFSLYEFITGTAELLCTVLAISALILLIFIIISTFSRFSNKKKIIIYIVAAYGFGFVITFIAIVFSAVIGFNPVSFSEILPSGVYDLASLILLFAFTAFNALLAIILFTVEYRLLDRHLNLY